MSYKTKSILLTTIGLLAFYAIGLRDTRYLTLESSAYATIAVISVIKVIGCVLAILALRAIERFEAEKTQFFLVLGATVVVALALIGLQSVLSNNQLMRVLLDDLPKAAIILPLLWIVRKEKLTRKEANKSITVQRASRVADR